MADETVVAEEPQGSSQVVDESVPPVVEEEPKRPEFLDPRFKTVEDQAKAYREAEKKMTQEAQRRAEVERELQVRQMREAQVQAPPQRQEAVEQPQNLNEIFWQNPVDVIDKVVSRRLAEVDRKIEPFVEDRWAAQKSKYANDEDFKRYEPQIDMVFKAQPQLKQQPGAIDYVYNFLRSQNFNPAEERQRIEAQVRSEITGATKKQGQVEGGSPPAEFKPTPKVELNEEERRAALRFYSDLPAQEAYKRYYNSKTKWENERRA